MNLTSSSIYSRLCINSIFIDLVPFLKSLPTQERAIKKRIALLKAAVIEFSNVGFEVATAKSIAAVAGVATGTFYQYFDNKNEILRVIAENRYAALHEEVVMLEAPDADVQQPIQVVFKRVLSFLYDFHLREAQLHEVLDQRRGLDPKLDAIMSQGEELMRSRVVSFIDHYKVDEIDVVADSLFAMGEGLVHHMVFVKQPKDPEKMLKVGAEMLASYFALLDNPKN